MSDITINEDGSLEYPVWWKQGGMMVRRDCLPSDHPEQTYNYLKKHGVTPENYGMRNPEIVEREQEFAGMTRDQLIDQILSLRKEVIAYGLYA